MKFSPATATAGIALLSILTGALFSAGTFDSIPSAAPSYRFVLGFGVSALIIGLGGVIGRLPRAVRLLSSGGSDKEQLRGSFQELVVYSASFAIGSIILLSLASFV